MKKDSNWRMQLAVFSVSSSPEQLFLCLCLSVWPWQFERIRYMFLRASFFLGLLDGPTPWEPAAHSGQQSTAARPWFPLCNTQRQMRLTGPLTVWWRECLLEFSTRAPLFLHFPLSSAIVLGNFLLEKQQMKRVMQRQLARWLSYHLFKKMLLKDRER